MALGSIGAPRRRTRHHPTDASTPAKPFREPERPRDRLDRVGGLGNGDSRLDLALLADFTGLSPEACLGRLERYRLEDFAEAWNRQRPETPEHVRSASASCESATSSTVRLAP